MFAKRTGWDLTPNALTRLKEKLLKEEIPVLDLTESNPTKAGFDYPENLLSLLSDPGSLSYDPDPKGELSARQAVASIYTAKGISISANEILLTASTSEAYSFLFRLLADPGDEILIPSPSYPLFEYLGNLHDVAAVSYPLRYGEKGWRLDEAALEAALSEKTKAIVVVHPNNPTGSCLRQSERETLLSICRRRHLPLIADEVFAEYLREQDPEIPRTLAAEADLLTFALGGLSKFMGLPQMKLAWIAATGPAAPLQTALERLELIADTFLSVATPIQRALPRLIPMAPLLQKQIGARCAENQRFLKKRYASHPKIKLLESDGGWNAVLKIADLSDEESFVLELLEKEHVFVHPGYFFDFKEPGFLVISLLVLPESLEKGVDSLESRL